MAAFNQDTIKALKTKEDIDKLVATYPIKPSLEKKFRPTAVKGVIEQVLKAELSGKQYDPQQTGTWTKHIADKIKRGTKLLHYPRYKVLVHVLIGEQKGEGVRVATRCLWDAETDNYTSHTFLNDSLFAVATVYGIYYY